MGLYMGNVGSEIGGRVGKHLQALGGVQHRDLCKTVWVTTNEQYTIWVKKGASRPV